MRYAAIAVGLLLAGVGASGLAHRDSGEILGTVVGVSDGDTITVLDGQNAQHKIRLNGIDAPEEHQAFGQRAKQALSAKVFNQAVRIETHEKDKYGRTIGDVFVAGRNINEEMVKEGWAWHFVKYSNSATLASAEQTARQSKAGLWADAHPVAPWDFRLPPVDPALLAADVQSGTVYVTKTGAKYHTASCRFVSKSKIPIPLKDAKAKYSPCSVCKPPH